MVRRLVVLLVVGAMAVGLSACGRSDGEGEGVEGPAPTAGADPACQGVALEATDTGVSADSITIVTMADVGSPLAPGLFQANLDAMQAFAEMVNAEGGLACRELVVETWDSKLSADEAKNGQLSACASAVAMVGGNSLFNPDVATIEGCPDRSGAPTGIADVAALANDVNEQCAENAFIIQAVAESCPVVQGQVRDLQAFVGNIPFLQQQVDGPLRGVFLVPADLPTTVQSATYQIAGQAAAGVEWVGTAKVSGRDELAAFTPRVQLVRGSGANYVYDGSADSTMISMRREAEAQGLASVEVWGCSLACYTPTFRDAGAVVDGTYLWMQFLPFEEADTNEAAQAYVDSVDAPEAAGAQAWQAGMLFRQVVETIVGEDGPNAVTRGSILAALAAEDDFTASGWMGDEPKPLKATSNCFVLLQLVDGEFQRRFPEERGTLDCDPANVATVTLDPAAEAAAIG